MDSHKDNGANGRREVAGHGLRASIGQYRGRLEAMGDRSPKSVQKQAAQKQTKNNATKQQKGQAIAAKQGNNPKRGK